VEHLHTLVYIRHVSIDAATAAPWVQVHALQTPRIIRTAASIRGSPFRATNTFFGWAYARLWRSTTPQVVRPVTRLCVARTRQLEVAMIGRARRRLWMSAAATVVVFAAPAFAQKPADAPKGATAQCVDGTFSTAKELQGACSAHGGVRLWWGAGSVVAPPPMLPRKTTAAPKASSSKKAATTNPNARVPERPTAKCNDGTYSFAKERDKACLRQGGVEDWFKP